MKILMADDDRDDIHLSRMAFDRVSNKPEVDFVTDGEALITHLKSQVESHGALPDLILLDLNMPKKNGLEVLSEIKAHPALRQLKVTVFTTSKAEKDKLESLNRGADSFIVKPANFARLVEVFREICREPPGQ